MKIGILGTGGVGKAFAVRLTELGHQVMLGTRDVMQTLQKTGEGSIAELSQKHKQIQLGTFAEASTFGELVLNVSKGSSSLEVMKAAGKDHLKGKIVVDISNPLDFSKGMPPSLLPELSNTNSLAEEIQKLLPDSLVVKTLNTMWNGLMINPKLIADGNHINFICGNDENAKNKVRQLLKELGWEDKNILDLGDLSAARATEAVLPIWLRIYGAKKSGAFNFQIVSQ